MIHNKKVQVFLGVLLLVVVLAASILACMRWIEEIPEIQMMKKMITLMYQAIMRSFSTERFTSWIIM